MKKFIFALLACAVFATSNVSAQNQTIGGSFNFSDEFGISARYTYAFGNLRLAPELGFFFPGNGTWFDINTNVHYTFNLAPRFNLYPLAGFNVGIYSWEGHSDSAFAMNLGAGGEYLFSQKVAGFLEMKGVLGDGSRAQFSFGVAYRF